MVGYNPFASYCQTMTLYDVVKPGLKQLLPKPGTVGYSGNYNGFTINHGLQVRDGLNAVPTTSQEKAECQRILSPQELHQIVIGQCRSPCYMPSTKSQC